MEEIHFNPGDEAIMSFVVKGIREKIYNIENFLSRSSVYMLKTVLA